VHRRNAELELMGKERKNKSNKVRIGISFEKQNLELLDEFAKTHFKGDRSAANNYIIKRTLKKKHSVEPEGYRPLTAF
jgi:metal-responsive CopG/Arc/MetJ family transcriptional regulator